LSDRSNDDCSRVVAQTIPTDRAGDSGPGGQVHEFVAYGGSAETGSANRRDDQMNCIISGSRVEARRSSIGLPIKSSESNVLFVLRRVWIGGGKHDTITVRSHSVKESSLSHSRTSEQETGVPGTSQRASDSS